MFSRFSGRILEYSLKSDSYQEDISDPLPHFTRYVAVTYRAYGLDFDYLIANYILGLVENVQFDIVKSPIPLLFSSSRFVKRGSNI